jgi:hypothetical protein
VKRKDAPLRVAKDYGPNELISISAAIVLLADRDQRKNDSDRVRKARMRERIRYAVENRELTEARRQGTKCYVYGRLIAWAQDKWPGRYGDLVAIRDPIVRGVNGMLPGLGGKSGGYQTPSTLLECQAQLAQAMERIFALEEQLAVARGDAEQLRPDAEAWQRQSARNKLNAQQDRKPP